MEKIINKLLDHAIEGVDTYFHNGSMWLIFTERKQWIIELCENGVLWYHYDFFKNLFNYVSLDVVENQHYITMWVEDTIQNGAKSTYRNNDRLLERVEDTIQNGAKSTFKVVLQRLKHVEDAIQNGVKSTFSEHSRKLFKVEDAIQNGAKIT